MLRHAPMKPRARGAALISLVRRSGGSEDDRTSLSHEAETLYDWYGDVDSAELRTRRSGGFLAGKPIQEQFGQRVIDAFADFARSDLKTPTELENEEFSHVTNPIVRRRLSEVFYGVRWIYKLGLALLTKDTERAAHVRAQIVDYASVAEGLLADCLAHAIRHGYATGVAYTYRDPDHQTQPITWNLANPESTLRRLSFWWFIRIARDFGIIGQALADDLHWLRKQRNTVHLQERSALGQTAFLNQSRKAFTIATQTIQRTKAWRAARP